MDQKSKLFLTFISMIMLINLFIVKNSRYFSHYQIDKLKFKEILLTENKSGSDRNKLFAQKRSTLF